MTHDHLQTIATHFDLQADRYAAKYTAVEPQHLYQHEKHERLAYTNDWIAEYAERHPAGHLLDVGCGDGRMACQVLGSHPGWHATGVDVSAAMIRQARQLSMDAGLDRRVHWQVGTLPPTLGTVDVVVSLGVLGYQRDQSEFLAALAACVRPGGLLIFTFANALSITRRARVWAQSLRRMGRRKPHAVPFHTVPARVVNECLNGAGLRCVASRWLCFGLGLPGSRTEVRLSRWCETHGQQSRLADRIAHVALACYQRGRTDEPVAVPLAPGRPLCPAKDAAQGGQDDRR